MAAGLDILFSFIVYSFYVYDYTLYVLLLQNVPNIFYFLKQSLNTVDPAAIWNFASESESLKYP